MNIVLFTDTYPPFINGVSTSTYNLCQTLKNHGHNVLVVTPRINEGPLEVVDNVIYVPGIELKNLYGYRLTKLYNSKIVKMIQDFKPDVLHNQTDAMLGQFSKIVAKKLNIPIIYTYHTAYEDYSYYVTKGFFDRLVKQTLRSYTKVVAKITTEFITPSSKTKEYMRSVGNDIYVNIVPTGIDFSLFDEKHVDINKQNEFKEKNNIDKDAKIFLLLGRVAKEKSMDVSIKCFAKYHELYPEEKIHLVVVGGGPQKAEYELLSHDLGLDDICTFVGPVPASEVPFFYHLADIYTSASLTETQGLTFMEAMASSAIVIARYDDNLSGTIIEGYSGYFFTDENSFAVKCKRILDMSKEEADEIRKNALKVVDIYSIERFYQNIIGVYKRAIRKYW